MSMFSHSAIASLNNLEMMVYNYVIKNRDKVMYMTIREPGGCGGRFHYHYPALLPQAQLRWLLGISGAL